jgi:hypothetical protein
MTKIDQLLQEVENLGLKDVSSKTQRKNNTVMYYDPETETNYAVYIKSGYVRRLYKRYSYWRKSDVVTLMYPLNARIKTKNIWDTTYKTDLTIDEMYEILVRSVINWRKKQK